MVRAKFQVRSIEQVKSSKEDDISSTVKLVPVYDSNPESENGKFYKATPWGSIELGGIKEETLNEYELGQEYYVDFHKAE